MFTPKFLQIIPLVRENNNLCLIKVSGTGYNLTGINNIRITK